MIGQVLVKRLQALGARLFVGDLKPRPADFSKDILYREGDLNTIPKEELLQFEPHYFFHLAAGFERSFESYDFWKDNQENNVLLSHHLIDCLKNSPTLKKVVFASSYLVYDPKQYLFEAPQAESVRLHEKCSVYPRNLCGMAKLLHEGELRFLTQFEETSFTFAAARIFRSYGKGSQDVISRWIRSLLVEEEIVVYCKEGSFDYIFADDVAEGLLLLGGLERSVIVNLGRGRSRKVQEVVSILRAQFPKMETREEKANFPLYEASLADMDLFQTLTGWQPAHDLEDAIPCIIEHELNK